MNEGKWVYNGLNQEWRLNFGSMFVHKWLQSTDAQSEPPCFTNIRFALQYGAYDIGMTITINVILESIKTVDLPLKRPSWPPPPTTCGLSSTYMVGFRIAGVNREIQGKSQSLWRLTVRYRKRCPNCALKEYSKTVPRRLLFFGWSTAFIGTFTPVCYSLSLSLSGGKSMPTLSGPGPPELEGNRPIRTDAG